MEDMMNPDEELKSRIDEKFKQLTECKIRK